MIESDDEKSILDSWAEDPLAAGVAAALGAAAGVAIASAFKSTATIRSGDEPPIRVRHGSVVLDLLAQTRKFEKTNAGDKKNWRIQGEPERGKEEYLIIAMPSSISSTTFPNGIFAFGKHVRIFYKGASEITISAPGKKTKIKGDHDFDQPSGQSIKPDVSGDFIQQIRVDGNLFYHSGGVEDPVLQVLLLDL